MPEVLHITTHMGGGVGKVLSGVAAYAARTRAGWRHRILLLEPPEKTNFIDACRADGVEILCGAGEQEVLMLRMLCRSNGGTIRAWRRFWQIFRRSR